MSLPTKPQLRDQIGQAYGSWFWSRPGQFNDKGQAHRVEIILDYRRHRAQLARGDFTPEINARGNEVIRGIDADAIIGSRGGDRYHYDFGALKDWKQYDTSQDASYFGVWVDVANRRTFSYVEGDRVVVLCPTLESFQAELADMERFYGPPPPAFIAIGHDGSRTDYYDLRPAA